LFLFLRRTKDKLKGDHLKVFMARSKEIEYETYELCDYECGNYARYKFKNGKLCCCKSNNSCPKFQCKLRGKKHSDEYKKKVSLRMKGHKFGVGRKQK